MSSSLVVVIAIVASGTSFLRFYAGASTQSTREYSARLTELIGQNIASIANSVVTYVDVYTQGRGDLVGSEPSPLTGRILGASTAEIGGSSQQFTISDRETVQQMVYSSPAIDRIFVEYPDGSQYYFDRLQTTTPNQVSIALRSFVEHNTKEIRSWWGSPYWFRIDADPEHLYLTLARFRNSIPEFTGTVTVGVPLSYFEAQYPQYRTIGGGALFVFNRLDSPIYGVQNPLLPDAIAALQSARSARDAHPGASPSDVVNHATIASVYRPSRQQLTFVSVIPKQDLQRGFALIRRVLLGSGAIAAVIAFLLAWGLSTGMTRDLSQLLGKLQKISAGNLDQKVDIDRRDEIGELADSFNAMIDRLRNTIHELTEEKARKKEAEFKAVEAEYHALQASIDPHFLNNILESINSIAKLNGQEQITSIVTSLSAVMRRSIVDERRFVPLDEELSYIRSYLELQSAISGTRITYSFEVDDRSRACLVPKNILQPLVENAVKYGLSAVETDGVLSIVTFADGRLHVIVSDNGPGMTRGALKRARDGTVSQSFRKRQHDRGGFGIRSVRRRLDLLYGERADFSVHSSRVYGTRIEMILPLGEDERGE